MLKIVSGCLCRFHVGFVALPSQKSKRKFWGTVLQQINLHAIVQNALALKKRVGVPLVAVVKNDAYGHGLVRVANVLSDVVDGFAVATVDEALKIADTGVETMILLPCLTEAELTVASKRGFVVTLSDFP